jgi:hypothetical protein
MMRLCHIRGRQHDSSAACESQWGTRVGGRNRKLALAAAQVDRQKGHIDHVPELVAAKH